MTGTLIPQGFQAADLESLTQLHDGTLITFRRTEKVPLALHEVIAQIAGHNAAAAKPRLRAVPPEPEEYAPLPFPAEEAKEPLPTADEVLARVRAERASRMGRWYIACGPRLMTPAQSWTTQISEAQKFLSIDEAQAALNAWFTSDKPPPGDTVVVKR